MWLSTPQNQDRAGGWTAGDCGLFFVADGIGGHYSGETASQAIADALAAWWDNGRHLFQTAVQQQLQLLIQDCHTQILQSTPAGQQCGSTLVLLWLNGGAYTLLWAGDSRCYRTRRQLFRGKTQQLTVDDVVPASAPFAADRGKLRQAVGVGNCLLSMRSGELEKVVCLPFVRTVFINTVRHLGCTGTWQVPSTLHCCKVPPVTLSGKSLPAMRRTTTRLLWLG